MKKMYLFLVLLMLLGTGYLIIFSYESDRIFTYLTIIPIILFPFLLRKTRYCFFDKEYFLYYLFMFLSEFLGYVFNLYECISWYDSFIHYCLGIVVFLLGLFILKRTSSKKIYFLFEMIFSICFVMFVASVWEFFEFGIDVICGLDFQDVAQTGVADTMIDMLVAFCGGLVSLGYFVLKKFKLLDK